MDGSRDADTDGQSGAEAVGSADDEAACWRHAARLRREFPGWLVIWVASSRRYRAYRLSSSRRDSALTAQTPDELAAKIVQAGQGDQ
jgi:hypothetical protein